MKHRQAECLALGIDRDCQRRVEPGNESTAACSRLFPDQEPGVGPVGEVFA